MGGIRLFFSEYWDQMIRASATHLIYVVVSVLIAFVLAMVLSFLLTFFPKHEKWVMKFLSIIQTVPGIVFIGLLFLILGMNATTLIIALSIYAIFPILKNTYTALMHVSPDLVEAAKGCGMTTAQILFKVKLPIVLPAIFTGLRMSTIYTVSWAVLGAMIGLGGLGELIFTGIASNNNTMIFAGAAPSAVLAAVLSILIDLFRRLLIPRSFRGES